MKGLKLFRSYCHVDEGFRIELEKWLATLRSEELVTEWDDRKVSAGREFETDIDRNLIDADIVLLMISQDYLASMACQKEMNYAIANRSSKRVIPIILKPCTWKETECRHLLALPTDGFAIEKWPSSADAWLDVFAGIKKAVQEILRSFAVKEEYAAEIQQIEFVSHNKEDRLTLDDVFTFPNLTMQTEAEKREVLHEDDILKRENRAIIISGEELSGKTALLRSLYKSLRGIYSPILLDGNAIFKSVDFESVFRREFDRQMIGSFDDWLLKSNKAVLIDDFHHKISRNIISYLLENFAKVILAVENAEYLVYYREDPAFAGFSVVTLRPFSLSMQEKLIRKWMSFGKMGNNASEVNDLEIDKLEEKVNAIVSVNQIVPRFPFYILTILQSFEMFMPKDYGITAHGHCYQALLTAQLIRKDLKLDEIDSCLNFLTELAFDMYMTRRTSKRYGLADYCKFKERYSANYYILKGIIRRIEERDYPILKLEDEVTAFEYSYIYYFFLGKYLATHSDKLIIDEVCHDIHYKENAFIIIFTVHHAQKKDLLDTIMTHCASSFDKIAPAELTTEETKFMQNLVNDLPKSIISNRPIEENRQRERELSLADLNEAEEDDQEDVELIEITKSMRIIEVLAQILKNRGGSFDKKSVLEVLENTIDLGLRILRVFLNDLQKPEFASWLHERLSEAERESIELRSKSYDDAHRVRFVEKAIQLFGYITTISMLNKISHSLRSDKLLEPIAEISKKKRTPAYDIVEFLVRISQKGLDSASVKTLITDFEKSKNYWAERTLSFHVQQYLNTHRVLFRERQRIFEMLGLKYIPNA